MFGTTFADTGKYQSKIDAQEFYLHDAAGRTLGILDMLGGQDNGEGLNTGAWT